MTGRWAGGGAGWQVRFLLVVTALLAAPQVRATIPGEERGRLLLIEALENLGGADRIRARSTWLVSGDGSEDLSAEMQGVSTRTTWRRHEECLAVDTRTLAVAWERKTPRCDWSLRWRRFLLGADSSGVIDFTGGYGVLRARATPAERRRALARRVPQLLLLEAVTAARRAAWVGERRVHGDLLDLVEVELSDGAVVLMQFSRAPTRFHGVEYRTHLPARGDVTVSWEWPAWRPDPGSPLPLVPIGHRLSLDGRPFQEVTYVGFESGVDIGRWFTLADTSRASVPGPPSPVAGAAGFPAVGEPAPGVHIGNVNGFVVLLVEFPDFVVVMEAPDAQPGFEAIPATRPAAVVPRAHREWVRETARGKPIRYAVVSHHHGDHLGGIRWLAAEGATILVPPGDVPTVRALLTAPHTLSGDTVDVPGSAVVEGVDDRRVIESGGRRLELIRVGANPHTEENLLAWLPGAEIIFQGDLFYFGDGQPFPPSGRDAINRFFADWLAENGIAPRAVYGVHNDGAAGPEALARSRPPTTDPPRR
jgi:glyoxylase-like metal-dependent hydrolase (beta-lactamase superfamily II)